MEEEVRDAVFGNVGTIVSFRVGAEDAEYLEKEFTPQFIAEDIVNLAKYNIYLKLMIDGLAGRPFSALTLPPFVAPKKSFCEKIIKVSRERYSTPREIVEGKIARWTGTLKSTAPLVKTGQSVLFDAQCSNCKKWVKVPFQPDPKRPVFCKPCLKNMEERGGSFSKKTDLPEPIPPSGGPFERESKPKRKEISLTDLRKVLEDSLGKVPFSKNSQETKENKQ
jgi:CxxC-x17-CxxC domain-containing protein